MELKSPQNTLLTPCACIMRNLPLPLLMLLLLLLLPDLPIVWRPPSPVSISPHKAPLVLIPGQTLRQRGTSKQPSLTSSSCCSCSCRRCCVCQLLVLLLLAHFTQVRRPPGPAFVPAHDAAMLSVPCQAFRQG
jgi:hypothetical protein